MFIDVDCYVINYVYFSNSDIINYLFDVINNKYYWWNWMVMVVDYLIDFVKYVVYICGGVMNNVYGKNVVVVSVFKNKVYLMLI